jgi:hypothetical protein
MPPELLVSGKLTPAADIYSFGVMSESIYYRACPCATTALQQPQICALSEPAAAVPSGNRFVNML